MGKNLLRVIAGLLFGAGLLAISAADSSATYVPFTQITTNSGSIYNFGVDVTDNGGTTVLFKFSYSAGGISEVYFDNRGGILTGPASYANSAGVDFSSPATPANLPAGNTLSPPFVSDFSFGATSSANRVDANGEYLGLIFNGSYDTVMAGLSSGQLRIGEHVQSLANGQSESFATPIPSALLLFGSGLVGLVGIGRWKLRK